MPDHIHMIVGVPRVRSLAETIRHWKSYQSRSLGILWQAGFFDHRLRTQKSVDEKIHYVRMNPESAGLVDSASEWPHLWPKPSVNDDCTNRGGEV